MVFDTKPSSIAAVSMPPRRRILGIGLTLYLLLERVKQQIQPILYLLKVNEVIPDLIAIVLYSAILMLMMAKKSKIAWCPQRCGRRLHDGPCDDGSGGDWAEEVEDDIPAFSGEFGRIARIAKTDGHRATLLMRSQIRTHKRSEPCNNCDYHRARKTLREDMAKKLDLLYRGRY